MLGETNPADSKPGTIRGDFCVQVHLLFVTFIDFTQDSLKDFTQDSLKDQQI